MRTDYVEIMLQRLSDSEELRGFRLFRADEFRELGYPVSGTIVVIGLEEASLGCLLGGDSLFGEERLSVIVMTDEKQGGAFCAERARQLCSAMLDCDAEKMIVSVCVEKCMYDRTAFAYKVIMRVTLREHEQHRQGETA